jgi:hypothetical protein
LFYEYFVSSRVSSNTPRFALLLIQPKKKRYLWAYAQCGFAPLLERAQQGLTTMMENYPAKWVPTDNGIAMQRARIILPLAFLVRANDTALHRQVRMQVVV